MAAVRLPAKTTASMASKAARACGFETKSRNRNGLVVSGTLVRHGFCMKRSIRYNSSMNALKTAILYHANCPDGFGGAYAAWKKFGDSAEYIPVKHGKPIPENLTARSSILLISVTRKK